MIEMVMLGSKTCPVCQYFKVAIWQVTTDEPDTKPVPLALCPKCDKLTPS